ncbi:uncharacterized protein LOC118409281 [Branchiostoma floridae]|uniref:Uncharacterized protein LOC118409281 n=1 Tax=Branchiostoma floridae TaxID=7739 RepID=A0A9J7HUE1_BRAFL|nr:uncharacterized protein LOC118409281 [Branchiostoma floridae]
MTLLQTSHAYGWYRSSKGDFLTLPVTCHLCVSAPVFYHTSTPRARTVPTFSNSAVISEPAERLYSAARNSDDSCVDRFNNCNLVVQARMCHYGYYKKVCCASCFHNKGYS